MCLRMPGQYCVGVGTLWSWHTHVYGCEGGGQVAEVHTNSCLAWMPHFSPCKHEFTVSAL